MLAIVISSWLPALGLILPFGAAHRANALVAGIVGTVLCALSLADRRARFGAALVGAWVALSPFLILQSTLLEKVVTVSWGVAMFTWLIGPFSESPAVTWVKAAVVPVAASAPAPEIELPRAA
jgi:low temperature requirement protein LtrA